MAVMSTLVSSMFMGINYEQRGDNMILRLMPYILTLSAFVLGISLISYNQYDQSILFYKALSEPVTNWAGQFGAHVAAIVLYLFGCSAWLSVPACITTAVFLFDKKYYKKLASRVISLWLLMPLMSAFLYHKQWALYRSVYPGGIIGFYTHALLLKWLEPEHVLLFLITIISALSIILLRIPAMYIARPLVRNIAQLPIVHVYDFIYAGVRSVFARIKIYARTEPVSAPVHGPENNAIYTDPFWKSFLQPARPVSQTLLSEPLIPEIKINQQPVPGNHTLSGTYMLPHEGLLSQSKERISDSAVKLENETQARALEHKLEQFGIHGKVVAINQGPAITLFEYQPSIDTKISTILARENDLALALQAISLRIIAPIAGKSVVGFEVARAQRKTIYFAEIFSSSQFTQFSGLLPLVIGKDTLGRAVVGDMTRMPHLLIAGSTGSGKSIGLHALIMSLLCSKNPDEVRLILIDPKRLEFSTYADIPHLLFPIVTEPKKAVQVLTWAVRTMEERYSQMARAGVRNIEEYQKAYPGEMSFMVIIIDELADLMMTSGKEVEHLIARLAQMARAAGIHIIVATQRPSVDVITGVIKVNFPSRIAFKVTSKVDSRTIIDGMGAEKLLGKGDMLFLDSSGAIQRIQGVYVPESDVKSVVTFIRAQRTVVYEELQIPEQAQISEEESDALFDQVINYVKTKDEISISLLQRVFKIGYNRSARIIDQLEARGHIRQHDGSKMRKVVKEQ
jgi:DNA segregation ATPase FtsK/SpoIIIE, S-DNA-T family